MRNSNWFGTTSDLKVRVQMHGFSLVCASCVVFVGYFKATHPLCALHQDTVWFPRSHCWVQYSQLYVLNDTQRGLHLLWPFCKTGVASDQCSVCVCVLLIIPYTLKRKTTKGSLSICLTLCEQMHCGSGATNFSQQTADAGVVQQHPEDSAGTQLRLSQPHQHRRHTATVPDAASRHLLQDDRLFAKVPLKKKQLLLSFHSWWAAIAWYGHNLSFSKKTDRTVSNWDRQWKTRSHTPSCTCIGMHRALRV